MGITTAERQQYQLKGIEAWLVKLGHHEKVHHIVEPEPFETELNQIKSILKKHKSQISFLSKYVKPPVCPPRQYFTTNILTSGKRVPFTKYAAHKKPLKKMDVIYETNDLLKARMEQERSQRTASTVPMFIR
ncbi:hypothetical protein THRCLA_23317 [Thraustotheca clavata]|uniref:Uncharacterized protein n=1 Tax=Thraustotheca clavata TaxID=74557 RepID=A0A1V9Y7I6_9STRA|nr:hypothetical protein THRCLA_23317 [Thraustotheca clavata]